MKHRPEDTKHKSRRYRPRFAGWVLRTWVLFALLLVCDGSLHPMFSDAIPIWAAYLAENSDIRGAYVYALVQSPDGALWVGTVGGLGRLEPVPNFRRNQTEPTG
jgi:hypothetical protein